LISKKIDQKRGFAKLSRNSKVVFDAKAEHRVQLDDPDAVIESIRDVQRAVTRGTRLLQ